MDTDNHLQHFEQLFGLAKQHRLILSRSHTETRNGTVFEIQWLEERNESNTLISRYRSWSNRSQRPPYRKQKGWERFSAKGQLMDREVRYSKRDTNEWLH